MKSFLALSTLLALPFLVNASASDYAALEKRVASLPPFLQKLHLGTSDSNLLSTRDLERRTNCILACLDTDCSFCSDEACVTSCDYNCPICCAIHNDNCYDCATDYDCEHS